MKILFLKPIDKSTSHVNDFLLDSLLIGLRAKFGNDVIDFPAATYIYKNQIKKPSELWGGGFTLYDLLEDNGKIDRSDIKNKIQTNFFDIIICGAIRGENLFYNEIINSKSKIAFIDSYDDPFIDEKKIRQGLYFKRELYEAKHNVLPISYAIPKEKIAKEIKLFPSNVLSPLAPGNLKTYIYTNEKEYFKMYQDSLFSITTQKTGWDCLRHYEILASGSLPFFLNLENCPSLTCSTLPKREIKKVFSKYNFVINYYNPFKYLKKRYRNYDSFLKFLKNCFKKKLNSEELIIKYPDLNETRNFMLEYTKKELTSEKLCDYVLKNLLKS